MLFGRGLAVFVGHSNIESRNAKGLAAIGVKGIERRKAGLAIARKQRLEALVHIGQDRRAGTEIGGDRQDAVRVLRKISIARPDIGADIGATEPIDRLLGITD